MRKLLISLLLLLFSAAHAGAACSYYQWTCDHCSVSYCPTGSR